MIPQEIGRAVPTMVLAELNKLNAQQQNAFVEEFRRKRKSVLVGYCCWFLFGIHYIYVHKWGLQIVYWLTVGGIFLWALIDLFRMPQIIRDYNKDVAIAVMRDLKIMSTSSAASSSSPVPPITSASRRVATTAPRFSSGITATHPETRDELDDIDVLISHAWQKRDGGRSVGPICRDCGLDMGMVLKAQGMVELCPNADPAVVYESRSNFYDLNDLLDERVAAVTLAFQPDHFAVRVMFADESPKVYDLQPYPVTLDTLTALCKSTPGW